jgi:hypothetical protein
MLDGGDDVLGAIMYRSCQDLIAPTLPDREKILENIKTGHYTFLLNSEGKFYRDHMELVDD